MLSAFLVADQSRDPFAQAAQSLAAGDLSTRTGAPASGSRDELSELMRDFDRMAERIEGLVDSQSRLLKDVSHELRSPLARLSVALGLARQKASPEIEASLNRIELEADRLNQLIQRLLTISRLESGADGLSKTRLSLRELVEVRWLTMPNTKPRDAVAVSPQPAIPRTNSWLKPIPTCCAVPLRM